MTHTYEALKDDVKLHSSGELQTLLYCGLDLYLQIKESHWTLAGREFLSVHRLLDDVASCVSDAVDDIAERIAQLGVRPRGTLQMAAEHSNLLPYPHDVDSIDRHIEVISERLAFFTSECVRVIGSVDEQGDVISADLLTSRAREIDKLLWLVESHLPTKTYK
ncbi:DNA starvation/stationary phase protection protein Dps [Kistimonas asteriae]|uniref:DNA starvation/stationary phase protection protein Dps n=1 Tax=Kistimonas asteriae TaxID=517724 RepID=UPI001BA89684|nr:DNA starvation/stationary phase protection protein Dps [Kistimonas asteriae]